MAIERLSRQDALTNLYNQALQELVVAELNVKAYSEDDLINPTSETKNHLTEWMGKVAKMKNTLKLPFQMIDEEARHTTQDRKGETN